MRSRVRPGGGVMGRGIISGKRRYWDGQEGRGQRDR